MMCLRILWDYTITNIKQSYGDYSIRGSSLGHNQNNGCTHDLPSAHGFSKEGYTYMPGITELFRAEGIVRVSILNHIAHFLEKLHPRLPDSAGLTDKP